MSVAGHLRLHAAPRPNGRTALTTQSFRAPFHVSKPYWDDDTRTLLVHVVNPTAGILAGDSLEAEISAAANASLLVTTPSASRVFTMRDGLAECRQRFAVAAHGWLEVLPEPLVPHRGSRYRQHTTLDVAPGGGAFFVDQLVPGRLAHGEAWAWSELSLSVEARIDGELVLHERFAHGAGALRELAVFAGAGPSACFANAVLIPPEPDAAPWRPAVERLHGPGAWVGVSTLRRAGWTIKVVAADPLRLRETIAALRHILAAHFPRLRCNVRKL